MPDSDVVRETRDGVDGWLHVSTGRWLPRLAGGDGSADGGGDAGAGAGDAGADAPAAGADADAAADAGGAGDDDAALGEAGKEALKRERAAAKAERKRADELAAKVKEYEDRDKTEAEKREEKLKDAEARAVAAERQVLVHQVAAKKGLTGDLADLAERLVGETKEELEKDADKLIKSVGATGSGPRLDQGARNSRPAGSDLDTQFNSWIRGAAGTSS